MDDSMDVTFDISLARNMHLRWEYELEAMVHGTRGAIELYPHDQCELGRWLQQVGIKKYQDTDAVHKLVGVHREFHAIADRIVANIRQGNIALVEADQRKIQAISREIVFMLTVVEFSAIEKQRKFSGAPGPIRRLLLQLFDDPSAEVQESGRLDVSHARLMHFRWSRDLLHAFHRSHGIGPSTTMKPSDQCDLGRWVHDVGMRKHGDLSVVHRLDREHRMFHAKAEESLTALKRRDARHADQAYGEMLQFSQEVVYLLSVIEYKLQNSDSLTPDTRIMG
jgi:hypothetical protein